LLFINNLEAAEGQSFTGFFTYFIVPSEFADRSRRIRPLFSY
jgi:hypothetical protein